VQQERQTNFKVVIRVRPPLPRELNAEVPFVNVVAVDSSEQHIVISENLEEVMDDTGNIISNTVYSTHDFAFDHVYVSVPRISPVIHRAYMPCSQQTQMQSRISNAISCNPLFFSPSNAPFQTSVPADTMRLRHRRKCTKRLLALSWTRHYTDIMPLFLRTVRQAPVKLLQWRDLIAART
jgi:hypothetical protein